MFGVLVKIALHESNYKFERLSKGWQNRHRSVENKTNRKCLLQFFVDRCEGYDPLAPLLPYRAVPD